MKCLNYYGIAIFFLFLNLNMVSSLEKKQNKKAKKSLISNANNLAIAVLMRHLGSKQTYHSIVYNLNKKCNDLKILERTKTSLRYLRKKFGFVRKSLKTQKLSRKIRNNLFKNFITRLIKRLLKCSVIRRSKVARKLKKSVKLMKKGVMPKNALAGIKRLVKATGAKRKPGKEFFGPVRKYYQFLNKKKLIKKIIKMGLNPLKGRNHKSKKSQAQIRKIKNLNRNIKRHVKRCVMFKGKFAEKGCDKVKIISRKIRKISKKLLKKLSRNCKSARTYCIHKGSKLFCRRAHKICKNMKVLKKKLVISRRMRNASHFAKIVENIISNILKKNKK